MEPQRIHQAFLGTEQGSAHILLYTHFPETRGFSSKTENADRFEATFVAGLTQTFGPGGTFEDCLLLVPASKMAWVTEQMTQVAGRMFARWKMEPDLELRRRAVTRLAEAIKHMLIGSRVLRLEQEPPRWVAFGFTKSDPVPEWLKKGLLAV